MNFSKECNSVIVPIFIDLTNENSSCQGL